MELLIAILITHIIALAVPGPDFFLILKTSLSCSKKYSFLIALGIACGVLFHFTFSIFFLRTLAMYANTFFEVFRILGCGYLTYLGIASLISGFRKLKAHKLATATKKLATEDDVLDEKLLAKLENVSEPSKKELQAEKLLGGFFKGLLTNLFNPKVMAYFMGVLAVLPGFSSLTLLPLFLVGLSFFALTWLWFFGLAKVVVYFRLKVSLEKVIGYVEAVAGLLFLAFATRFLFEKIEV